MSYSVSRPQTYCYQDYLKLPAEKRFEIIDGVLYDMTPAPTIEHQIVLGKLFLQIGNYLKNNTCKVLITPCDVLLPEENEHVQNIKTVVQPDIFVICDESKLTKKHCLGPPDWIIEIVSPTSASMDYVKKLNLYEKHKVKEYWIVNYVRKEIMVYKLQDNDGYSAPDIYKDGKITSVLFNDLNLNLQNIFD